MKNYSIYFRDFSRIGLAALFVIRLNNLALGQSSKIDWDVRYGDSPKSYQVQGAIASATTGDIFIGGYYSMSGSKDRQRATWLWKINASGEKVQELDIVPICNKLALVFGFSDIALLSDNLLLTTLNREGEPMLIALTTNGDLKYALSLAKKTTGTVLMKIVPGTESSFFLLGQHMRSAVVYKLDSVGNVLWEQSLDNKKLDYFVDGVATPDGGLIAVENSSEQALPLGPCDLSIVYFDTEGHSQTKSSFPGRDGSLVRTISGKLILVYKEPPEDSTRSTEGYKIKAKGFDKDFTPLWTNTVTKIFRPFDTFSINRAGTNYFIAGSTNLLAMWAVPISEQGNVGEAIKGQDDGSSMGDKFRILAGNTGTYVVFSALGENEAHKEANKVGIIKIKSK